MDSSLYKDLDVQGLRYHYYCQAAKSPSYPTLLFLHGFPLTSENWASQVVYFSAKGYGVIAPDMLGYGGTSKPVDVNLYDGSVLAAHCINILDAEHVDKVVTVSHDWGSRVGSRLANLYPGRLLGSIFISAPYLPPNPNVTAEQTIRAAKEQIGRDLISYWKFFASEEAPALIAAHEESFYSLLYTSDPQIWNTHFSPEGQLQKWLENDEKAPIAAWAPDMQKHIETFKAQGWYAPTQWYRSLIQGALVEGDKAVPKERYVLRHPVLQIMTLRDPFCIPSMVRLTFTTFCTNVTFLDLDTGHWPMFENPGELNGVIDEFVTDEFVTEW